jgi:hypothetical protein
VITPTQIALSEGTGKISIYDLQVGSFIAEFNTGNSILKLNFHVMSQQSFLWFAGGSTS